MMDSPKVNEMGDVIGWPTRHEIEDRDAREALFGATQHWLAERGVDISKLRFYASYDCDVDTVIVTVSVDSTNRNCLDGIDFSEVTVFIRGFVLLPEDAHQVRVSVIKAVRGERRDIYVP